MCSRRWPSSSSPTACRRTSAQTTARSSRRPAACGSGFRPWTWRCCLSSQGVPGRALGPRDLLHVNGSKGLDRTVAAAVQYRAATQRVGLSATGPGSHQPSAPERPDYEPGSLIRTGSTLGGAGQGHPSLDSSDRSRGWGDSPLKLTPGPGLISRTEIQRHEYKVQVFE